jgi:hypothetical protein
MDQLKQYWEVVKKQHFWILCGLAVVVPLIVFWVSSGHLAKVYGDQLTTIKQADDNLTPLVSGADHPNKEWVTHVQGETDRLRVNVKDAWDALYAQQQAVLKWPPELGDDFAEKFKDVDPKKLEPLCELYQNSVKTELKHMADIVKAEWAPGESGHGRSSPALRPGRQHAPGAAQDADEAKKNYIVVWDPADEGRLQDDYDWVDPPSPLDVRYAQEELWVLEAICKSIDRTNVGSTGDFDAVVREIQGTLIGYTATDKFPLGEGSGRIDRSRKTGAGGGMAPAAPPAMTPGGAPAVALEPTRPVRHRATDEGALGGRSRAPRGGPVGMAGGQPGVGPAAPTDPDELLKEGRYVDTKGKPLRGSDWANSTTPEFNLMAFKLTVVADEQRWPKLLVELCNSPIPLEVREVRINPNDREGGGPGAAGRDRPRREAGSPDMALHNVTLEIHGVAYLMNPPNTPANLAKLGIAAVGANPAASPVAPQATPPIAAPTPAAPASAVAPAATAPAAPTGPPVATPTTAPPVAAPTIATPPAAAPATTAPPTAAPTATTTPPTTAPPTTATPTAPPTAGPPAAAPPTATPVATPAGK